MQCSKGHHNAAGQKVCGECGEPLNEFDGIAFFLGLFAVACAVMFLLALVGTADNRGRNLTDFAYLSASSAVPWAILGLLLWGAARIHSQGWQSRRK